MRHHLVLFSLLAFSWSLFSQGVNSLQHLEADYQSSRPCFEAAYSAYPRVPRGVLEAVSYTNTHFRHLTDADYGVDEASSMPRSYGLMGLVEDGKRYFRDNLSLVARLSGMDLEAVKTRPDVNVLAYAAAFSTLLQGDGVDDCLAVVERLSELPVGEGKDAFPMQAMLYSVCSFLSDARQAQCCGFVPYAIDMRSVFGEALPVLSSKRVVVGDTDYPKALWRPADPSNYSERTEPVSGVVVHYTAGSYAGCISWFQNPDADVSAHYVIRSSDGQVTQMVREADKAWHARSANAYTIGIEHEAYGDIASYFTPEMYASSADLVRDICSRYESIDGHRTFYRDTLDDGTCLNEGLHDLGDATACTQIRGHQHYPGQSHTDPGPYWDWNGYYKLINQDDTSLTMSGEDGTLDYYGDDERMIWRICGPQGSVIHLDFDSFYLEEDLAFLCVYDGADEFAPLLGRWNTKDPGTVSASGNELCVELRSECDSDVQRMVAGWEAVFLMEDNDIWASPNPASDEIRIHMPKGHVADAVVYDLVGNQVVPLIRFVGETSIDITSLSSGIYVLRFGRACMMDHSYKFVKQ